MALVTEAQSFGHEFAVSPLLQAPSPQLHNPLMQEYPELHVLPEQHGCPLAPHKFSVVEEEDLDGHEPPLLHVTDALPLACEVQPKRYL